MAIIASSAGRVAEDGVGEGGRRLRTNFIGGTDPAEPQAFLIEQVTAPAYIKPHFHHVRQFQVMLTQNARLGKRDVSGISFHYADPSTPYGPIYPGEEDPLSFFTLRPELGTGAFHMPGSRDKMQGKAGRNIICHLAAEVPSESLTTLIERHDDGLAAYRLSIAPSSETEGVPGEGGGGQYYLVLQAVCGFRKRTCRRTRSSSSPQRSRRLRSAPVLPAPMSLSCNSRPGAWTDTGPPETRDTTTRASYPTVVTPICESFRRRTKQSPEVVRQTPPR